MKIQIDLKRYSEGGIKKAISTILLNPCFHSVALYRLSSFMYHIHLTPFAKIIWYLNRVLFNADIDFRSEIGGGFKLVHGLGVVIGKEVRAGNNLTIYQGVTLGGSGKYDVIENVYTGQPYIGNNVTVYTGAGVFGPIKLVDNEIVKAYKIVTEKNHQINI